jgi:hypothetical protein
MFEDDEIINYENTTEQINKIIENRIITPIELEDLKLNQEILITFIPYSQKYIYKLIPKFGKLKKIPKNKNIFKYKIIDYNNKEECLFHSNVSYYGDSLGYEFIINLIE